MKSFAELQNRIIFTLSLTHKANTMKFNKNFFASNRSYTLEMAENIMFENGYSNFQFKGSSFTNGASFYFTCNDKEIRVSDHTLTGKRAFNVTQLSFAKPSIFEVKANLSASDDFKARIAAAIAAKSNN
jgi:hypothetical protein